MRALFKTDYDQDIRLFRHAGAWWSYAALLLLVLLAPLAVGTYLQSQIVFVFIYAIVGVALLILTGFTGQASLGHAAFLAIGAYTAAYLQRLGLPFVVYLPLAAALAGGARAAAQRHLPCHRHHRLRLHHRGGGGALGERHQRQ